MEERDIDNCELSCRARTWAFRPLAATLKPANQSPDDAESATSNSSSEQRLRCMIDELEERESTLPVDAAVRFFRGREQLNLDPEKEPDEEKRIRCHNDYRRIVQNLIAQAAERHFKLRNPPESGMEPAAFLDFHDEVRFVYKQIVIRFRPGVTAEKRDHILRESGFEVRAKTLYTDNQWIVHSRANEHFGQELFDVANYWAAKREVDFAVPNFVSEYTSAFPRTPNLQETAQPWHLRMINADTDSAYRARMGSSNIIVAVLDDGVDLEHSNLKSRVVNFEGERNYSVPDSEPGHTAPNPRVPLGDDSDGNKNYHGTHCAGLIVSDGTRENYFGVAPNCRFISVKVLDNGRLIPDEKVSDAIRYAARVADVLCCAWTGGDDLILTGALEDAANGRGGKGTAIFCASGNHDEEEVAYPANDANTIAVGACTRNEKHKKGWNFGNDLDVVAPSRGDNVGISTTDVSGSEGENPGGKDTKLGDEAGDFYNEFGGTSAATAIAAGVGALCLSVNPDLTRQQLRKVLHDSANPIGASSEYKDKHSVRFGYGLVDAHKAIIESEKL